MPYYSAMGDYYQGDNYQAGGLFSFIGKAAKALIGASPIGQVAKALIPTFARPPQIAGQGPMIVPTPGFTGRMQRFVPGGASGFEFARRRRMNPLNIKALRRAMRRAKGFERQARRVGSFFKPGTTFRLKGRKGRRK